MQEKYSEKIFSQLIGGFDICIMYILIIHLNGTHRATTVTIGLVLYSCINQSRTP